jgi:hypothetical protein
MSVRNFVPTLWSAKLFQELDKNHVLVGLANRDYEGEISAYGDSVKINGLGDITVNNYAPNVTSITPQQLTAEQTILLIDQAKYFAFYLDDVDAAQTKPKLMAEAMRKSAVALGNVSDQLLAGFYTDAGVSVSSTSVTIANALSVLAEAAEGLDENNVPMQGRWMVIPPWFHSKLVLNKILETDGAVDANNAYGNGFVGRAFGFDMYMSNNLTSGLSTTAVTSHYALAGTSRAISFAEQVVSMEAYRPENSFSDAVKGLHVYGAKVVDPNALASIMISTTS